MPKKICLYSEPGQCSVDPGSTLCFRHRNTPATHARQSKNVRKHHKTIRTCIRISRVAQYVLCLRLLPPVNLTSQDLPAKTTYACSMHPLIPWQTRSEIALEERYLQTSGPTKLHELCEVLRIVFLTTLTQELPGKSLPKTGNLVHAYAMAALPSKEKFLTPLVVP